MGRTGGFGFPACFAAPSRTTDLACPHAGRRRGREGGDAGTGSLTSSPSPSPSLVEDAPPERGAGTELPESTTGVMRRLPPQGIDTKRYDRAIRGAYRP